MVVGVKKTKKEGQICAHSYVIIICTVLETAAQCTRTCSRASLWGLSSYSCHRRSVTVHCSATVDFHLSTEVAESICSVNKVSRAQPVHGLVIYFIIVVFRQLSSRRRVPQVWRGFTDVTQQPKVGELGQVESTAER